MQIDISPTAQQMGQRAAEIGGELIEKAIAERGVANIIVATGASQFEVFHALTAR